MKIDPSSTALLIVDMQKYQAGAGGNLPRFFGALHGPGAEEGAVRKGREVLGVIAGLIPDFRGAGARVVYLAFGSLTQDGSDLVPYVRLWNDLCRKKIGVPAIVPVSDPGYAILEDIAPGPSDPVVNKTAQGPFGASSLDHVLRQMKIDTLVVSGMYTNHCVIATCIEAADAGYRVIVPEDAVGSWSEGLHARALDVMRAWVIRSGSADVIRGLRKG